MNEIRRTRGFEFLPSRPRVWGGVDPTDDGRIQINLSTENVIHYIKAKYPIGGREMNENFDKKPRRSWKSSADDSPMHCYLGMHHRITMPELVAYFAEHYPHVDPNTLQMNFITVVWDEPATEEERTRRTEHHAAHDARHAKWERDTYERLKEKFESAEESDV